jgi:hypothetical protein
LFLSVYTNDFSDEKSSIGKYHCKIPMKNNRR